jgi:hypothetical protein
VVKVNDVDGVDRRARVRVRGQQHPAGVRVNVHRPLEELDAGQPGHPVVREEYRHLVAAQLHLPQRLEGLLAGLGTDDPVPLTVPPAQVTSDSTRHTGIIVHRDDHRTEFSFAGRSRHGPIVSGAG